MKNLNKKGFTLIELLAVIVIMGILMLVAIPAIQRTIENSRRDTFADTAKQYINAIKTAVSADEIICLAEGVSEEKILSSLPAADNYYYKIDSSDADATKDLLNQGGKSSWGNADVKGYVRIKKEVDSNNKTKYTYSIHLVDDAKRGIGTETEEKDVKRTQVKTQGQTQKTSLDSGYACKIEQ